MSAPVERKMISICFLDLLHRLAVQARAKPEETKYLNAIVKTVEEIKEKDGFADGNKRASRVAGQEIWEKLLCRVFQIKALEQEELTEILYYYPSPRSVTKLDYETLIHVFGRASSLTKNTNRRLVADYMDAIHELPDALKTRIDRKWFYKGFVLPFKKKWPDFFTSEELTSLKNYSSSSG